jgi:hypothetical protein
MPKTVIEGVYAIRFNGFNREERGTRARSIAGIGQLTLQKRSGRGTASGFHRATNCPMTGQRDPTDPGGSLRHTKYKLNGSYAVLDDGSTGNPIHAEVKLNFVEDSGEQNLSDTFAVVQSGPNRFWLLSTGAQNRSGDIDEAVLGEAVKVGSDW